MKIPWKVVKDIVLPWVLRKVADKLAPLKPGVAGRLFSEEMKRRDAERP